MTEQLITNKKLASPFLVALASLVGGPFAGFWFIANNFDVLQNPLDKKKSLIYGIISLLAVMLLIPFLPNKFPTYAIPVIYSILIRMIMEKWQSKDYKAYISSGGGKASVWYVIGISLLFLLAFFAISTIYFLFLIYVFGWQPK